MLITRGLAEMTRIGTAYGASPLTFLSLAGVGDLFLTCSSSTSRNYTVGHRLGKGEKLEHIIDTLGSVAEGVSTSKGLQKILDDLTITAPIANAVRAISYSGYEIGDSHVITDRSMTFYMEVCTLWVYTGYLFTEICSGQEVEARARELLAWPPVKELDLPSVGKPAQHLMAKLGL